MAKPKSRPKPKPLTPEEARLRWVSTRELIEELATRAKEGHSSWDLDAITFKYNEPFYYCARCSKDLGLEAADD